MASFATVLDFVIFILIFHSNFTFSCSIVSFNPIIVRRQRLAWHAAFFLKKKSQGLLEQTRNERGGIILIGVIYAVSHSAATWSVIASPLISLSNMLAVVALAIAHVQQTVKRASLRMQQIALLQN